MKHGLVKRPPDLLFGDFSSQSTVNASRWAIWIFFCLPLQIGVHYLGRRLESFRLCCIVILVMSYLKTSCWMKKESALGLRTKFCMNDWGMSSSVWGKTYGSIIISCNLQKILGSLQRGLKLCPFSPELDDWTSELCALSNHTRFLLIRSRHIMYSQSEDVVSNEPRTLRGLQYEGLREPVRLVLVSLGWRSGQCSQGGVNLGDTVNYLGCTLTVELGPNLERKN